MDQLYIIKISGPDHTGITAGLMERVAAHDGKLLDIGQSITHGLLSLSFLIQTNSEKEDELLKDLLFKAKQLEITLDYQKVDSKKEVQVSGDKYILSCVCLQGITPDFLSKIAATLAKYNINIQRIDRTTKNLDSLDIYTIAQSEEVSWDVVKKELIAISNSFNTDMALLKDNVWRRNKRLIVFDMDSTLIQSEVIVEMAKVHGVGEKVHEITERAMNGELDFDQSLIERVKLLKGLDENKLQGILENINYTSGVQKFIQTVQKLGYKTAIISGGFTYFANSFKDDLGINYMFANELEVSDGKLTGRVKGQIVNAEKKALILEMIAQQENINLAQVVAIGDGANDLPMLAKAGLGIAFHAKEIVKQNAQQNMSHGPMTSILYFLGLSEEV